MAHSDADAAIIHALKFGLIKVNLETGEIRNTRGHLVGNECDNGYIHLKLPNPYKPGERITVYNHRVVYFKKCLDEGRAIPDAGLQIDHINGIKRDNRADNLEVVTAKENANNEITKPYGAKNPNTKITEEQKKLILTMSKAGLSHREIIEKLQLPICHQRISQIVKKEKQNATITN